jgi:hypothetical protein
MSEIATIDSALETARQTVSQLVDNTDKSFTPKEMTIHGSAGS